MKDIIKILLVALFFTLCPIALLVMGASLERDMQILSNNDFISDVEIGESEREYYRGVYDDCFQRLLNIVYCKRAVFQAYKNKWFEGPSADFDWLDTKGGRLEGG